MNMVTKQQQRLGMNLALQVSPCLTLGLLLIASFGVRTVASACDNAGAARRDCQQQQAVQIAASSQFAAAAAISALTERYPTQTLCGSDPMLLQLELPLAAPAAAAPHSSATAVVPSTAWRAAAQPRAP